MLRIREDAARGPVSPYIIAQTGGQENLLTTAADITIFGGQRGGSKSFSMLLDALYDVANPNFKAMIMRKEKGDLSDLVDNAYRIYSKFGTYNKSKDDMTWNFDRGGSLSFEYYSDSFEDYQKRIQGKQYAYIGIDEITHMEYRKFKYTITDNRNAAFLRNRLIGTCNPDPDSWVARFIDWWIGEDGLPVPERDGKVMYCFMDGEDVDSVVWGETREDVYLQCKETIDRFWLPEYAEYGTPAQLFVKSVCFIVGKLSDNKQLLRSDPAYLANLANQDEASRARDLEGNWRYKSVGDDLLKSAHITALFNNALQKGDGILRASCDVAFAGGDNMVLWLWEGWHIKDVIALRNMDSKAILEHIRHQLKVWSVQERNFTYDVSGLGQSLKGFFPNAVPFNNLEAPIDAPKGAYNNVKSQCAFMFVDKVVGGGVSINNELLDKKYSGFGYSNMKLRDILMTERRALRPDEARADTGRCLIQKKLMKRLVGHSPDFIEALMMRMIFELKHSRRIRGLGLL